MNMRQAILAALRRDPDLLPKVTDKVRERIDDEKGPMSTVVQAAEALEPILADSVRKRPSRLGKIGLKSAHLLANLAMEDERSNNRLAEIADGTTVGIVFVDIEGFLKYTAAHGDEAASELLNQLEALLVRSVKPAKGQCVKNLGDGFLLAFPSASQAVRGAVSVATAVQRQRKKGFPVDLRIAVHAGEPLVEQDDLLGHDVNLTARLLDHCKPGEIIVSDAAKELSERRLKKVSFVKKRRVKVRGLAGRVTTYAIEPSPSQEESFDGNGRAARRPPSRSLVSAESGDTSASAATH